MIPISRELADLVPVIFGAVIAVAGYAWALHIAREAKRPSHKR